MKNQPWLEDLALDLSEGVEILEAPSELMREAISRRYKAYRLKKSGMSTYEVAEELKVSDSSVNRMLLEMTDKIKTKYKLHLSAKYLHKCCDINYYFGLHPTRMIKLETIHGLKIKPLSDEQIKNLTEKLTGW